MYIIKTQAENDNKSHSKKNMLYIIIIIGKKES